MGNYMYLPLCLTSWYVEISIYLALGLTAKYREISMYLALS